jgi:hypothetical protein
MKKRKVDALPKTSKESGGLQPGLASWNTIFFSKKREKPELMKF